MDELPGLIYSGFVWKYQLGKLSNYFQENMISEESILEFCAVPRSRAELIAFIGKSRTYTMANVVNPLIEAGKLKMTLPEKPKSSKQKYVKTEIVIHKI